MTKFTHRSISGRSSTSRRVSASTPTSSRTKSVGGRGEEFVGRAACTTRPACMTTTRSASRSASSTSWVTNTIVVRSSPWIVRDLVLQRRAHDRVDRAERLVHQQHVRLGRERARDADALRFAAGELARSRSR